MPGSSKPLHVQGAGAHVHTRACAHQAPPLRMQAWPALSSKSFDLILQSPRAQKIYLWNSTIMRV